MTFQVTEIVVDGLDIPDDAARGITMTLEPIAASSKMERTLNGELIDVSDPAFRKYRVTLTCSDMEVPSLIQVWPGTQLTITCLPDLGGNDGSGGAMVLICLVAEPWKVSADEWGAAKTWSLALEQV